MNACDSFETIDERLVSYCSSLSNNESWYCCNYIQRNIQPSKLVAVLKPDSLRILECFSIQDSVLFRSWTVSWWNSFEYYNNLTGTFQWCALNSNSILWTYWKTSDVRSGDIDTNPKIVWQRPCMAFNRWNTLVSQVNFNLILLFFTLKNNVNEFPPNYHWIKGEFDWNCFLGDRCVTRLLSTDNLIDCAFHFPYRIHFKF